MQKINSPVVETPWFKSVPLEDFIAMMVTNPSVEDNIKESAMKALGMQEEDVERCILNANKAFMTSLLSTCKLYLFEPRQEDGPLDSFTGPWIISGYNGYSLSVYYYSEDGIRVKNMLPLERIRQTQPTIYVEYPEPGKISLESLLLDGNTVGAERFNVTGLTTVQPFVNCVCGTVKFTSLLNLFSLECHFKASEWEHAGSLDPNLWKASWADFFKKALPPVLTVESIELYEINVTRTKMVGTHVPVNA